MHNKSILAFGSIFISVGGWFLWNILLAVSYDPKTKIYRVRDSFFATFGPSGLWWFTLILIVLSAVVFEYGVSSLRAAWFTTDADEFQALEQDLEVRKRFEEASAAELQGGWEQRGKKKRTSEEILREEGEAARQRAEQEQREEEIKEILRSRPDELSGGAQTKDGGRKSLQGVLNEVGQTSMDVSGMLSQRFGSVKRK
jgi:phospholipid-translocating ATPase